ncbi:MAG: hypothetical protein ABSA53_34425, partial [Streptosporangiaceae bacterium]
MTVVGRCGPLVTRCRPPDVHRGPALAAGLDSWRELLAQLPPALELPADRPRPARQTFTGAAVQLSVPESLTAALT